MPSDLNLVLLEGSVCGETEVRKTTKGLSIITFTLLHRGGYNDKTGKFIARPPQTIEVTMFGERGEGIARTLGEGDQVLVHGAVSSREYNDKHYTQVIANNVEHRVYQRCSEPEPNGIVKDTPEHVEKVDNSPRPDGEDLPF